MLSPNNVVHVCKTWFKKWSLACPCSLHHSVFEGILWAVLLCVWGDTPGCSTVFEGILWDVLGCWERVHFNMPTTHAIFCQTCQCLLYGKGEMERCWKGAYTHHYQTGETSMQVQNFDIKLNMKVDFAYISISAVNNSKYFTRESAMFPSWINIHVHTIILTWRKTWKWIQLTCMHFS